MSDTGLIPNEGTVEVPKSSPVEVQPTKGLFTQKEAKQAAAETGLVALKRKKYGNNNMY